MSLALIKAQIDRFLQADTPEVMAIRGAWGVGKTFAWNKYLNEAKHNNGIALDNYSYVSLFGLNSMDELKLSIFMEVIHQKNIGIERDLDNIKLAGKKLSSLGRKALGLFSGLPYSKNFWPTIQSLAFYSIRKSIICLDDFERKGKLLDAQDIMGLTAFLKEQKKCKVILILNDESLGDIALIDYKKYREKVIDIELVFNPSASECADIALSNDSLSSKLKGFIESLGINNIRIIKKIERLSRIIYSLLSECEEEVVSHALHSLTLFMWSFYSNSKAVPDYDFIKKVGYRLFDIDDEKEKSDEEKQWETVLRRYNFSNFDEFDLQIVNAVEHGYVDEEIFKDEARKLNQQIVASKSHDSFSKAWRPYHESFDNDEDAVVNGIYNGFKDNIKYISPNNLDGTVQLFRELEKNEMADEMIDVYIKERQDEKKLFSLSEDHFAINIRDKKITEKFTAVYAAQKEIRTLKDVLAKIAGNDSWGDDDVIILSKGSPEDYYTLFKSEKGPHLSLYVDACLRFGRFVGATEQQKKIAENATIALKKIGKESVLNSLRVKKYGIKLETKEAENDT